MRSIRQKFEILQSYLDSDLRKNYNAPDALNISIDLWLKIDRTIELNTRSAWRAYGALVFYRPTHRQSTIIRIQTL